MIASHMSRARHRSSSPTSTSPSIDRARVARDLAAPLEYAQRVESVVVGLGIETLIPRSDERVRRFLEVWTSDEVGHGGRSPN